MCQSHLQTTSDQLKSSFNDQTLMHKKIRMHSAPKVDNVYNGIGKRRCNEQNEVRVISYNLYQIQDISDKIIYTSFFI